MGKNINNISNVVTVLPDGSLIYAGEPGGVNPDPYTDTVITKVNFFLPLQDQIDDLETDIIDHEARIQTLEDGLTKTLDKAQNTSYQPTQNADSRIINFGFRLVSGSPVVAVGTALGLDDIVSSRAITGLERSIDVSEYVETSRTLHITINSGSVDVAIFSRENLYEV
jgi:hypothetical protein